jgi:hypothetical protein
MQNEILLYGIAKGDKERYMEQLLATKCKNQADIDKVIDIAKEQGFHSFRVAFYDGSAPNFLNTINI